MTACELDLPRCEDDRAVCLGAADACEVLRETAKAVLVTLWFNGGPRTREVWFPKAVLSVLENPNPAFGQDLYAARGFVARNGLWDWSVQ